MSRRTTLNMCERDASKSRKLICIINDGLIRFFAALSLIFMGGPSFAQISGSEAAQVTGKSASSVQNRKPIARADFIALELASSAVNVLANDLDVDGDRLIIIEARAQFGAVAFTSDGLVAYAKETGQFRADKINYLVSDNRGGFDRGVVEIYVR